MYVIYTYARDHSEGGKISPGTSARHPANGAECTPKPNVLFSSVCLFSSLVPRLPPCFYYLACDFSTAGEIKARGKPGNEATFLQGSIIVTVYTCKNNVVYMQAQPSDKFFIINKHVYRNMHSVRTSYRDSPSLLSAGVASGTFSWMVRQAS